MCNNAVTTTAPTIHSSDADFAGYRHMPELGVDPHSEEMGAVLNAVGGMLSEHTTADGPGTEGEAFATELRRQNAATKLQSVWRGRQARKHTSQMDDARRLERARERRIAADTSVRTRQAAWKR